MSVSSSIPIRAFPLLFAILAALAVLNGGLAFAQSIICSAGGFGTVNTQATISGPNSMTMAIDGVISYPPPLNGPAAGTPISCRLQGWNPHSMIQVDCDATRTIANTGGCCGDTNRSMTAFSIFGRGNSSAGPTSCNGIGPPATIQFRMNGLGRGILLIGTTMDATHVKIGGTYLLSSHAAGVLNIFARQGGVGSATETADFSVVFSSLVGFTNHVDMQFGAMSYSLPVTAADTASMGTNATVAYTGSFSSQGGTVTAGSVLMNNVQDGVTVEVYCDTSATLARSGAPASTIQVTGIEAAGENARGPYGTGNACNSIAGVPAATMLFQSGVRDEFFLGGRLDGATVTAFSDGAYITSNPGGNDIQVTVLNQ